MMISIVFLVLVYIFTVFGNVECGLGSLSVPACVITSFAGNQSTPCSNPLYTPCSFGVCCGPHHYCCNYESYQTSGYTGRVGCCRRSFFNARIGELVSLILGSAAWGGIIWVMCCLTCPRLTGKVKPRGRTRTRVEAISMK
ncbi:hypothetical protein ACJMK2_019158 [Sinanodonta woodiana]|uniref:Cysteine rich secreted protein n=1 Tax=Sinanodonta woodiana TaxID=1069815 RepID=A0ABD3UIZ8_SINWO